MAKGARKRLIWKTVYIVDHADWRAMQSAWASSSEAFGRNKVMVFERGSLETNISLAGLRALARQADVKIDWANGIVFDSSPSWEQDDDEIERSWIKPRREA